MKSEYKVPVQLRDIAEEYAGVPAGLAIDLGETKFPGWARFPFGGPKPGLSFVTFEDSEEASAEQTTALDRDAFRAVLGSSVCRAFLSQLRVEHSVRIERLTAMIPDQGERILVVSRLSRARLIECDGVALLLTVEGRAFIAKHERLLAPR